MADAVPMTEIWRGPFLESVHNGHAVICDETGQIVEAWGDPSAVILPRSSSKMLQALPLLTSGAADAYGLTEAQLALSCASHQGAAIHTEAVAAWLSDLGVGDGDFRCGPQTPNDKDAREGLIRAGETPCRMHNNCSGKHSGFLTLTDETSAGYGIDGCSAPNFASTVHGLARAMAFFASAHDRSDTTSTAAARLTKAMGAYPELVAGEGRACTELMRAMDGKVAIKTGAEAVFVAIIPEKKLGVALKITDGATRASECAIASILVNLGVLDANHPATLKRRNAPIRNWDGLETGFIKPAAGLA